MLKLFEPAFQLRDLRVLQSKVRALFLDFVVQPLNRRQCDAIGIDAGDVFVVRAKVEGGVKIPLTSAVATELGPDSTVGETARSKPPLPLLVSTDNVLLSALALIKSVRPSPLTSAAVTEVGSAERKQMPVPLASDYAINTQ